MQRSSNQSQINQRFNKVRIKSHYLSIYIYPDYNQVSLTPMIKPIICLLLCTATLAQYNPQLSKQLCQLAVASYCKPLKLLDWSCGPCKGSFMQIQNVSLFINSTQNTLGFIAVSKKLDSVVIVFRGTDLASLKNWIASIKFVTVNYPLCDGKCKVHEGFYHSYMDINDQVIQKVKAYKAQFGLEKVTILGHGLGAALATHATAYLIKSGIKVTLLQTYGSPRVGNKQFSAWYQTIYPSTLKPRVTHGRDPVVHLPPEDLGFRHIQTEIFYQGSVSQGYKICNDERAEDKNCSDQYFADINYIDHGTYYDIDFNGIILTC